MACRARGTPQRVGGNGRVRQPLVVENRLSEGLLKLSRLVRELAKKIDKDEERQDFTAAAARLDGMAQNLEDWNTQKIAEAVYWVEAVKGRRARASRWLLRPWISGQSSANTSLARYTP